jgi:hypothetical protein
MHERAVALRQPAQRERNRLAAGAAMSALSWSSTTGSHARARRPGLLGRRASAKSERFSSRRRGQPTRRPAWVTNPGDVPERPNPRRLRGVLGVVVTETARTRGIEHVPAEAVDDPVHAERSPSAGPRAMYSSALASAGGRRRPATASRSEWNAATSGL